ncbi:MAG: GumC family protein [Croceivirga sp.]
MDDTRDLKDLLNIYIRKWKWFVIFIVFFVSLAFFYVRYTTPMYEAKASIEIAEDKDASNGLGLFKDMEFFAGAKNKVEDEIQIINSRSNLIEVVKNLGLQRTIKVLGNIRNTNIYGNPPFNINFIVPDSTLDNANFDFHFTYVSQSTFNYSLEAKDSYKTESFGKTVKTPIGEMVLTPDLEVLEKYKGYKIQVSIRPVGQIAQSYNSSIRISVPDQFSNIITLSLEDPNKQKAKDILNEIVRVYNKNAIEDKKVIADRTSDFIDARISEISSSLSAVDQTAEDFKTVRGVTDIASEANLNLNVGAANRQELANKETQLNIAASMKDIVDQQDGYEVLPTNLGLSDPTIANSTARYNQLVQERNRMLKSSNEKNPVIVNLDEELNSLKTTMRASLNSAVNNLGLQVNTLSNQQSIINSKIYSAPSNERALRDITRRQQTTESLYLYLLQKREEAQIAVASSAQKSKVIDSAYNPTLSPISPNKTRTYLASIIMGLLVPFFFIYLTDLLDTKIHSLVGLEKIVKNVPILGEIPKLGKKDETLVLKNDRSVLAESLRILRTNLDYLIRTRHIKNGGESYNNNIIFITSTEPGEGKTFLSSNISMILASTQKKVLLIGADIRNPKIHSFFPQDKVNVTTTKSKKDLGLTEYLLNAEMAVKDIVNSLSINENKVDVIYSGRIPPNPAELLLNERMKHLFEKASKDYDYVVVDTAPLMVVTDTLLISPYANHLIYVTRAGITDKKALEYPIKLKEEGKINGLCFVVNDVKSNEIGYGGKYGYGYGVQTKKWWKFNLF